MSQRNKTILIVFLVSLFCALSVTAPLLIDYFKRTVTVEFVTNGGDDIEELVVSNISDIKLPKATRQNYIFDGWYADQNLSIPFDASKLEFDKVSVFYKAYAAWLKCPVFNFETNGGSGISQTVVTNPTNFVLPTTTRTNYTLVGWFLDKQLTDPFDMSKISISRDTPSYTLYAKWQNTSVFENISKTDFSTLKLGSEISLGIESLVEKEQYKVEINGGDVFDYLLYKDFKLYVVGIGAGNLKITDPDNRVLFDGNYSSVETNVFVNQIRVTLNSMGDTDNVYISHSQLLSIKSFTLTNSLTAQLAPLLTVLKNLEVLDISQNGLNNVDFLSELTNLAVLNISGNPISNLNAVRNLANLQRLTANNCKLTSLTDFLALQALRELSIVDNPQIDDDDLSNVVFAPILKTQLEVLLIDNTAVSQNFVAESGSNGLLSQLVGLKTLGIDGIFSNLTKENFELVSGWIESSSPLNRVRCFGGSWLDAQFISSTEYYFSWADFLLDNDTTHTNVTTKVGTKPNIWINLAFELEGVDSFDISRTLIVSSGVSSLTLIGVSGKTLTNFDMEISNRATKFELNLINIDMTAQSGRGGIASFGNSEISLNVDGSQNAIRTLNGFLIHALYTAGNLNMTVNGDFEIVVGDSNKGIAGGTAIVCNDLNLIVNASLLVVGGNGGDSLNAIVEGMDGGDGIYCQNAQIESNGFLSVVGGNGGRGADGSNKPKAANGIDYDSKNATATNGANGQDGENGSNGGNGGHAIYARSLTITGNTNLVGGNGGAGGNGGKGGAGGNGGNAPYRQDNTDAKDGKNGGKGGNGGDGGAGGNGGFAVLATYSLSVDFRVQLQGGNGGNCGDGGAGGDGGTGGYGGNGNKGAFQWGTQRNGGDGGDGGTGGNGGNSANAGSGANATNGADVGSQFVAGTNGELSKGGNGGNGGTGGKAGNHEGIGEDGKRGAGGTRGLGGSGKPNGADGSFGATGGVR